MLIDLKGKPVRDRRGPATVSGSCPLKATELEKSSGKAEGAVNTSQETCLDARLTPSGERVKRGLYKPRFTVVFVF